MPSSQVLPCWIAAFVLLTVCRAQVPASSPTQPEDRSSRSVTASNPSDIVLPAGTPIRLRTDRSLSSESARVGDEVGFVVASDVQVAGVTVIARGTKAGGHVATVVPKRRMGRSAKLLVNIEKTTSVNGAAVALHAIDARKGEGKQENIVMNSADTFMYSVNMASAFLPGNYAFAAAAPVAIVATPLIVTLTKGGDVLVPQGAALFAYTAEDVVFDRNEVASAQPRQAPRPFATVYIYVFDPVEISHARAEKKTRYSSPEAGFAVFSGSVNAGQCFPRRYLVLQLRPGEYPLHIGNRKPLSLRVEADQDYFLKLKLGWTGYNFVNVGKETGEDELALIEPWQTASKVNLTETDIKQLTTLPAPPKEEEETTQQEYTN